MALSFTFTKSHEGPGTLPVLVGSLPRSSLLLEPFRTCSSVSGAAVLRHGISVYPDLRDDQQFAIPIHLGVAKLSRVACQTKNLKFGQA